MPCDSTSATAAVVVIHTATDMTFAAALLRSPTRAPRKPSRTISAPGTGRMFARPPQTTTPVATRKSVETPIDLASAVKRSIASSMLSGTRSAAHASDVGSGSSSRVRSVSALRTVSAPKSETPSRAHSLR